jgi:hypothetical protein
VLGAIWWDGADSPVNNTIYHLDNCEATATATPVAEVLSTHGANLGGREFTQIIGDVGRRRDLKRVLLVLKAINANRPHRCVSFQRGYKRV